MDCDSSKYKDGAKRHSKERRSRSSSGSSVAHPVNPGPSTYGVSFQVDMPTLASALLQLLQPRFDQLENRFQAELAKDRASSSGEPQIPLSTSLPPFDESNPWHPAWIAPCQNGMLTLQGVGTRPLEDLEFFLSRDKFPYTCES